VWKSWCYFIVFPEGASSSVYPSADTTKPNFQCDCLFGRDGAYVFRRLRVDKVMSGPV